MVIPAAGTLFMIYESSPLLDESPRNQFHSKVAQLLYLGKGIRINILTAVAFLTTRVSRLPRKMTVSSEDAEVSPRHTRDTKWVVWRTLNFYFYSIF